MCIFKFVGSGLISPLDRTVTKMQIQISMFIIISLPMINFGPGQLYVRPYSAKIMRNTEIFGQMAPFLQMQFEGQLYTTQVSKGSQPIWTEATAFARTHDTMLQLKLWDFQRFKAHDLIAQVATSIVNVLQLGRFDSEVEMFYKGKVAAVLKIGFEWKDSSKDNAKNRQNVALLQNFSPENSNKPYNYFNPNQLPDVAPKSTKGIRLKQKIPISPKAPHTPKTPDQGQGQFQGHQRYIPQFPVQNAMYFDSQTPNFKEKTPQQIQKESMPRPIISYQAEEMDKILSSKGD